MTFKIIAVPILCLGLLIALTDGKALTSTVLRQKDVPLPEPTAKNDVHADLLPISSQDTCSTVKTLKEGESAYFKAKHDERPKRNSPFWYQHPPRFHQPPQGHSFPPHPYFIPHFSPIPRPAPYLHTIKPKICTWVFTTESNNCQLVANFDHYESGDSGCHKQYLLLGDEQQEIQICGYHPFPGYFKSHGKKLFIKHFQKAPAWSSDFEGFVTCIKKYQHESPIQSPIPIKTSVPEQSTITDLANQYSSGEDSDFADSYETGGYDLEPIVVDDTGLLPGSEISIPILPNSYSTEATTATYDDSDNYASVDDSQTDHVPHKPYAETNENSYAQAVDSDYYAEATTSAPYAESDTYTKIDAYPEPSQTAPYAETDKSAYTETPYAENDATDIYDPEVSTATSYVDANDNTYPVDSNYDSYAETSTVMPVVDENTYPNDNVYPEASTAVPYVDNGYPEATPYPDTYGNPLPEVYADSGTNYETTPRPYIEDNAETPYVDSEYEPSQATEPSYQRADPSADADLNRVAAQSAATLRADDVSQ